MIPPPTVLATLPSVGQSQEQKFRTATVQSIAFTALSKDGNEYSGRETAHRKRRNEVVVACPNGAVQIYDVHSSRQITSYTSLPGSEFVCDPASVLIRSKTKGVKRRVTVAAVIATIGKRTTNIILWEERMGPDVPLKDKIRMFQQKLDTEDIARLDVALSRSALGDEQYHIIGVGARGHVRSWDEELRSVSTSGSGLLDHEIKAAFVLGIDQAREGIFRNREDLSTIAAARGISEILVSLASTRAKLRKEPVTFMIHFHGIKFTQGDQGASNTVKEVEALGSVPLPLSSSQLPATTSYSFYNFGASLFSISKDQISIFDLSRTTPKLGTVLRIPSLSSIAPISENIIATTDNHSFNVIDTRYQAILASRGLSEDERVNGVTNGINHRNDTDLVAFFPSIRSICAVQGNTLLSLQVEGEDAGNQPRKKLKYSTLADAVGRGLAASQALSDDTSRFGLSSEIGVPEASLPLGKDWEAEARRFEELAIEGHGGAFDEWMRKCLDLSTNSRDAPFHARKLDHILSLIFTVTEDSSDSSRGAASGRSLKIQIWPGKTLDLFSRRRGLSQTRLEEALKRTGKLSVVERLHPTAMVTAVAHAHVKTMKRLKSLFNLATSLDTREVMCAIRLALQRLQQQQNLERMRLLTAGPDEDGDEMQHDGVMPKHTPKHVPFAHDVIRLALNWLHRLHPSTYASAMAAEFSPPDLFALIDYLRLALARNGWFARHTDPIAGLPSAQPNGATDDDPGTTPGAPHPGLSSTAPESDRDPLGQSAQLAVTLLNCALDTLGTQGWLLTDQSHAAAMLGHMRAETSAALEGVEEAAYLFGVLDQMLAFATSVPPGALASVESQLASVEKASGKETRPIVMKTATTNDIDESQALPLGLRYIAPGGPAAKLDDEAMRRARIGEEPLVRSQRDMGRMKSMRVGVHSFERIVL